MKGIIVNRVSSNKQNPALQENHCLNFAEKKGIKIIKIFSETASAGKSKQKQIFEAKELAIKENACIIVWKYDRSFRNKKDFVSFMLEMYELHNIKVYSVQEDWVNMLWEITETLDLSKVPEPYDIMMKDQFKLMWKNMIRIIGKMAEQEIKDKGARVKLAVRKNNGKPTKSYKGNKWGRKSLSKKVINEVIELKGYGKSIREISKLVFYYDKHKYKKQLSKSAVHKILSDSLVKKG